MMPIVVITTVGSLEQARDMARALVERGLAACAQIEPIESVYVWHGAVQHDEEHRLLLKTTDERYDAVEAAIRELHPYELPAIHAFGFERAYAPYLRWIEESVSGPPAAGDSHEDAG